MILFCAFVGDKCQDHITAAEVEERHSEDSPADQLQAGWRALGTGNSTGKSHLK